MFFSNPLLSILLAFNSKMSRAAKAFLLLYTTVLVLFIIYRLLQFNVHKVDYPGGYALHISFVKENPSIFPSYPDKYSGIFQNSFDDQKKYSLPAIDEKDVVVLSKMNFSSFVANNQYVLVNFHAPWCHWSRKLSPEYALAATELKGEVVTAKVDSSKEEELALKRYQILGYPTICFFAGGVKVEIYNGGNKSWGAIANWTRAMVDLGIYTISSIEQAEELLMTESTIVLGFFDSLEGLESKELAATSKLHTDVRFYQTDSAYVAKTFQIDPEIKRPALILREKEAKDLSNFNGPFTKSAIAEFVAENKIPPVTTLTDENALLILNSPMKQLWLFALTNDLKVTSIFQKAAKTFKGKLLFVYAQVQMDSEGVRRQIAHDFGISGHTPRVVAYRGNVDAKKLVLKDELTLSNIKSFAEDFLEDNLSSESEHFRDSSSTPSLEL